MILERLPALPHITTLSPTMFSVLSQCPLRAGLRAAKAQQTTMPSNSALLGSIAHGVLEKAVSLVGDDVRSEAGAIWDALVKEQEEKLRNLHFARHLLPIKGWKNYFLLRARTIRQCMEIVHYRSSSATKVVSTERKIDSIAHGLTGKPDLIIRRSDGLVIIDHKSGVLPQEAKAQEEKIESWRRQLLFYAVIVHAEYGEWPLMGEIRMLNKEVITIPIAPKAAIAVAKEADMLMSDYNARINAGVPRSEMAGYSAKVCAFCDFKGNCDTFWRENQRPIPGVDDYGCLSGTVQPISWTKSGVGSLIIESPSPNGTPRRWEITNLLLSQFEYLTELTLGDYVRLLDFSIASDVFYKAEPTAKSIVWKPSYRDVTHA